MNLCSEYDLREDLRARCERESQQAVAKKLGFSSAFICDVLAKRRSVTTALAHKMGYIRLVQFQKAGNGHKA